jgi:hypothetical protein
MLKGRFILTILSALLCCSSTVYAQRTIFSETSEPASPPLTDTSILPTISPVAGEAFYEIASGLAKSEDITPAAAEQAIVLLIAADEMGYTNERILPLLITLATQPALSGKRDYSQQVYNWISEYAGQSMDLDVAKRAITYLLDRYDSREQREKILEQLLMKLNGKNAALDSELDTRLGLLMLEKADPNSAESLFIEAYLNNKYNKVAFEKLTELVPNRVGPLFYLEHLLLLLRENPVDIETAMVLAQYTERLQLYQMASASYGYCAALFSYLYPNQTLPSRIYIPWIVSSYNSLQDRQKCLQIADAVRKNGRFDILVEAVAGRAAEKLGKTEDASLIFQAAELKTQQSGIRDQGSGNNTLNPEPRTPNPEQFAWFYCFAWKDSFKALDWANKAYSSDPNSPVAASLLAYALVINQQLEWAKSLIHNYERNQISDLAQAQILLAEGQQNSAIEILQTAINGDPGSLAAERAKEILAQQGRPYVPPADPNIMLAGLRKIFGQIIIPEFNSPNNIISVQFNTSGNEFPYGSEIGCTVAVRNNSSVPLVISSDGLFKGNIRIDADVRGDLNRKIPNLLIYKIRSLSTIEPGKNILIPMELLTGELKRLANSFPQASLEIEFTLYIDPVVTEHGQVSNTTLRSSDASSLRSTSRLADIKPIMVMARRPGLEFTGQYLQNRFSSISAGPVGTKNKIAELFVGLLKEQSVMAQRGALYRYKYADWMPRMLKSAVTNESGLLLNPVESDWVVKVYTMAAMLSLPLDQELMNAVAKNLNHPRWPVRMMAVFLLAKSPDGGFDKVLDWIAKNDSSRLVCDMATAFKTSAK